MAYKQNGEELPEEEMAHKQDEEEVLEEPAPETFPKSDSPQSSDPSTEEILERYRQPKSNKWATRKWLVNKSLLPFLKHRVAADGRKYLVRAKQKSLRALQNGPGGKWIVFDDESGEAASNKLYNSREEAEAAIASGQTKDGTSAPMLDDSEVKALTTKLASAIDDIKSLVKAPDLPKHYKVGLKHVADQIWYVGKALTDKGKEQKTGGKGSELSDKGKEQRDGGKGSELSDKGEQQGKSPTKAAKNNGRPVSAAVERKLQETLAKLRLHGVLNGVS